MFVENTKNSDRISDIVRACRLEILLNFVLAALILCGLRAADQSLTADCHE